MSMLLSCHQLQKSFASKTLFEGLSFGIEEGDRIGVIGSNGVGKSTLMKILAGEMEYDGGSLSRRKLLKTAFVHQTAQFDLQRSVEKQLRSLGEEKGIGATELDLQVPMYLSRAGFEDFDAKVGSLSGGWRKRLAIAAALLGEPDLIFLDEPTNHLDFAGVHWLEDLLKTASFAWVMISHDRFFLDRTVSKIAEINPVFPGGIFLQSAAYTEFQELKTQYIDGLAKQEESLSNKVRRELEWLRRQPKARGTKARYRVEDAKRMMDELSRLRQKLKTSESDISFGESGRKTKRLLVAKGIGKSYEGRQIFSDLDLLLSPKMVLGILGPNGCGKSTLLKALQNQIPLDTGSVTQAPDLKVVYFEQNRDTLDPEETLRSALSLQGGDSVIFQGRSVHIVTWARRFQFDNDQLGQKIAQLSGGEQARVLIARLMQQEADLLILDEPTNDLDIETLEVLEDSLADFNGCVVLVTHDRYLISRLSSLCLGFLATGETRLYADYQQWEKEYWRSLKAMQQPKKKEKPQEAKKPKGVKLSYMEQREYDKMEELILEAEAKLEECSSAIEDPEVLADPQSLQKASGDLQAAQEKLDGLYSRWTELEEKQQGNQS